MKHYLISGLLDISLMTTSCEQVKKGNEEMISISSLPFYCTIPPLYSNAKRPIVISSGAA